MARQRPDDSKNHSVTIVDVARESGVSYSTVSRVLNGYEYVKETTRQRVLDAANRLGYVANLQARSLAGGRSQIVGVLVPGLDNGYIGEIVRGIDLELARSHYDLMMYTTHRHRGKESQYANAISNGLTDGLLLIVPLVPTAYLAALRGQNYPYVLIDQGDPSNMSSVVDSTNWQGAYDGTRYLIELGHRRIGFITGLMELSSATQRLDGFKAALIDHDIAFDPTLVIEGDYWQRGGYAAAQTMMKTVHPFPSAIFAANDLSAFGAMEALREAGKRIPEDVSILGFDDIPQASMMYPKLTTIRQPLEQIGRVGAKVLLERIARPHLPAQHVTLSTQLVVRDSCIPHKPGRG